MYRSVIWVLALVVGVASHLPAQQSLPLGAGDRVRIKSSVASGQFTVEHVAADTLVVRRRESNVAMTIPLAAVDRLDVHRGRRSKGEGAVRGLAVGFVVGAVGGAAWGASEGDDFLFTAEQNAMLGGLLFAAIGGGVGALIGAASAGDRWARVHLVSASAAGRPQ